MTITDTTPSVLEIQTRFEQVVNDPFFVTSYGWVKKLLEEVVAASAVYFETAGPSELRQLAIALDQAEAYYELMATALSAMTARVDAIKGSQAYGQLSGRLREAMENAPTEPVEGLFFRIKSTVSALDYLEQKLMPGLQKNVDRAFNGLRRVYDKREYPQFRNEQTRIDGGLDEPTPGDQPTMEELDLIGDYTQAFWAWFNDPCRQLGLAVGTAGPNSRAQRGGRSAAKRADDREFTAATKNGGRGNGKKN